MDTQQATRLERLDIEGLAQQYYSSAADALQARGSFVRTTAVLVPITSIQIMFSVSVQQKLGRLLTGLYSRALDSRETSFQFHLH